MQSIKSSISAPPFNYFAWIAVISLLAFAAPLSCSAWAAPTFQQIDYPGAAATKVYSSARSTVTGQFLYSTGVYISQDGKSHGWFQIGETGTFQNINCPDAVDMDVVEIGDTGSGEITILGSYLDASGNEHGFVYHTSSGICDSFEDKRVSTTVTTANSKGGMAGFLVAGTPSADLMSVTQLQENAVYRKPGGKFIAINVPDATYSVHPMGLNNKNVVTGDYDGKGGFVWPLSTKTATEFACAGVNTTLPVAINDKGVITGGCGNYNPQEGFVRDGSGNITLFTPSLGGTSQTIYVYPQSINSYGTITGWFEAQTSYGQPFLDHGFIRNKKGIIKVFDYPHTQGEPFGTHPLAINDNNVIVGYYVENGVTHGFERAP